MLTRASLFSQDNVLAAEKPPDAPSHEAESSNVFLKKDDFLFDPFDSWKGAQGALVSENDVFMFDESTTLPPPAALQPSAQDSESKLSDCSDD